MAKDENCPESSRTKNKRAMKEAFKEATQRRTSTGKRANDLRGKKDKDK